ncbi:MAG TPA: AmmeMemoRadiSam system protein B, partial [Nitrososphaerales archaeon]|nr:AmmeMemoRadiSam system protein B [Nitrososphaerales archaeon]
MASSIRLPVVSGQFYPSDKDELYELIHRCFTHALGPGKFPSANSISNRQEISRVECLVVPHAGYIYSGPVAAHSYRIAFNFFQKFKDEKDVTIIILGPNHYGIGSGIALSGASRWRTPLGDLKVASELGKILTSSSNIIDVDEVAHSREHSIEVQIPFLQAMGSSL